MRAGPIPVAEIRSVADIAARLRGARQREALAAHRHAVESRAKADAARAQVEAERVRESEDRTVHAILSPERIARSPRRIIARVADEFGVTPEAILQHGPGFRRLHVKNARWAAIAAVKGANPWLSVMRLTAVFGFTHGAIEHALRMMRLRGIPRPDGSTVAMPPAAIDLDCWSVRRRLLLRWQSGWDTAELAQDLGVPESAIDQALRAAREDVRAAAIAREQRLGRLERAWSGDDIARWATAQRFGYASPRTARKAVASFRAKAGAS